MINDVVTAALPWFDRMLAESDDEGGINPDCKLWSLAPDRLFEMHEKGEKCKTVMLNT